MDVWKAHQIMDKLPKKSDAPNLPEKYHIFQVPAFCQGRSHCKKTFVALNILPTPISFFISSPLRFKIQAHQWWLEAIEA